MPDKEFQAPALSQNLLVSDESGTQTSIVGRRADASDLRILDGVLADDNGGPQIRLGEEWCR